MTLTETCIILGVMIAFATLVLKVAEFNRKKQHREGSGWHPAPNAKNPRHWHDGGS